MTEILMPCATGQVEYKTTSQELADATQLALAEEPRTSGDVGVVTIECRECGEEEQRTLGKASMILWLNMTIAEHPDDPGLADMLQTVITDFPDGPERTDYIVLAP